MIWPQSRCRGILPAATENGGARLIVTGLLTTQTIDGYLSAGIRLRRALLGVSGRLNDDRLLAIVLVTDYVTENATNYGAADAIEHLVTTVASSTVASVTSSATVTPSGS